MKLYDKRYIINNTLLLHYFHCRLRAGTIVGVAANISYLLAIVLHPYMPNVSRRIREQCGLPELPLIPEIPIEFLPEGHKIGLVCCISFHNLFVIIRKKFYLESWQSFSSRFR